MAQEIAPNYALYILEEALRKETQYLQSALQVTEGYTFVPQQVTVEAFRESAALAQRRIPHLQEAIAALTQLSKQP